MHKAFQRVSPLKVVLATSSCGFVTVAAHLGFRRRMSWTAHGATNEELIANLASHSIVKTPAVIQAMAETDRGLYVADPDLSYLDSPSPIGYSATISAPHMHGYALELLHQHLCRPGAQVLDVGSGSGYLSAVFARIVALNDPPGRVVGIEHIPQLVETAMRNVRNDVGLHSLLDSGALALHVGDGWQGWPPGSQSPTYDAIHVGAAAASIPKALVDQLNAGGRMVIPVGPEGAEQQLAVVDKRADGGILRRDAMGVVYVPLTTKERQLGGR